MKQNLSKLKPAAAQLFPLKWSLWFLWHSFVDLPPLNLLPGKQLRKAWLGACSSPPGIIFLFLDGVAQCLWTLTTRLPSTGGPGWLLWADGEMIFHRKEARGCWDKVDMGWGRWLKPWCLRLLEKLLKSLGVTLQVTYSLCPDIIFSLLLFSEITAPTLWIKHLVIKDSKLNNTNVRNSGK